MKNFSYAATAGFDLPAISRFAARDSIPANEFVRIQTPQFSESKRCGVVYLCGILGRQSPRFYTL